MEGFTIVDAGVAVIVLMSAILAYSRGFVREIFAILGWLAAAFLAFTFAGQAEPLVKQVPVLDKFLGTSCELSMIAAFAAVFAVSLLIVSIFIPIFSSAVQRSALSGVDQALGFLFGVARGVLLVGVAFLVYNRLVADSAVPMIDNSRSAKVFASFEDKLNQQVPSDAPGWIAARYNDLTGKCGTPSTQATGTTEAPASGTAAAPADGSTNTTGAKTVTP
ncbi:MAG: CvpA family protein [Paracoccaceae bacterium]|jgi:membrane protein required for colicin V production